MISGEVIQQQPASAAAARRAALLTCLRWDAAGTQQLEALSESDWGDLFAIIAAGGGQALLIRRLARPGHAARPPERIRRLLENAQRSMAGRAFRSTALILECVAQTGRQALFLKGIDISQRIYGGFGTRRMSDIDLLVRPRDLERFHHAFTARGFVTDAPPSVSRQTESLWSQASYEPPTAGILPIDLHWRLGKREEGIERDIDTEAIWARAEPYFDLGRDEILVMSREDLLLYLCLHLRHHTYDSPLTQVWDIAELLEWTKSGFDWSAFWKRAEDWGLTRTVALAFVQTERTLGVNVPCVPGGEVPASVARLLPDVLPNLGLHRNHERVAEPHVATLFAPSIPLSERIWRLWDRLFPSRGEIAARFDVPRGSWRIIPQYLVYWRQQGRAHGHFVFRWLAGDRGMREQSDRIHGLSLWLAEDRSTRPSNS